MLKLYEKDGFGYRFQKAEKNSKGIIVFIHGYATTSEYHDSFAEQLTDYDYYTFELPGHGFAELQDKKHLRPKVFANMIIDWMKIMKFEQVFLIGHSMGGGIAGMIAAQVPEMIIKLVMTTPMNSSISLKLLNIFKFVPKNNKETFRVQKFLYKDVNLHFDGEDDKKINEETQYQLKYGENFKILRSSMASLKNHIDLKFSEMNINVPTLLILGEHDGIIDYKTTKKLFSKYENFTIKIFKNSGHLPFIEESEE
ncbi:MAG: alpha/beta hydrolase, partial [Malacoplasma sp.]|nr:alpha/beta hydrolase [Malacoplasma sp.]